jgi:hypothetical protein
VCQYVLCCIPHELLSHGSALQLGCTEGGTHRAGFLASAPYVVLGYLSAGPRVKNEVQGEWRFCGPRISQCQLMCSLVEEAAALTPRQLHVLSLPARGVAVGAAGVVVHAGMLLPRRSDGGCRGPGMM